jgi:hypothetical protein
MKKDKKLYINYALAIISIIGIAITDQGVSEMIFCLALVMSCTQIAKKEFLLAMENEKIVYEKIKEKIL